MSKKFFKYINYLIIFIIIKLFFPVQIHKKEFSVYRVALDPGHGGLSLLPISKHGDRYSLLKKQYIDPYREGAHYKGISEHIVTYSIIDKVQNLLNLTRSTDGFQEFSTILKKYGKTVTERIEIIPFISRNNSENRKYIRKKSDPNDNFRIFDYPDKMGKIQPGRISRINAFKPHLLVVLHCDIYAPRDHLGFTSIICPSYDFFYKGLEFLRDRDRNIDFFRNSPYLYLWFMESTRRSSFKWFANDTSIYFTGYRLKRNYSINYKNFKGYRHNMVTWRYKDAIGWQNFAKNHEPGTRYAIHAKDFAPEGKYWERERSKFEKYRRSGGYEGFGGDNFYASQEIIRYMLTSLKNNKIRSRRQKLGNPYVSAWSMPLFVNAVTAYIELGYLSQKHFRFLLTKKQDELAEGIAVGIYSLFAGLPSGERTYKDAPLGKKIDFDKYKDIDKVSYFDKVVPEYGVKK